MLLKICGITNIEDAHLAFANHASHLGFIFYDKSPRSIAMEQAKAIISSFEQDKRPTFVGVFVNEHVAKIHLVAEEIGLDMIQLHGQENVEDYLVLQLPIIKAVDPANLFLAQKADYVLLDTSLGLAKAQEGDQIVLNKHFNLSEELQDQKLILSGGLAPDNVMGIIKKFRPYGIDVSRGVEKGPGQAGFKDAQKVQEFCANFFKAI